jgi:hypothetical protein
MEVAQDHFQWRDLVLAMLKLSVLLEDKSRWEDNIKIDLRESWCEEMEPIKLAHDRIHGNKY